jgi:Putative enzyme of poly-gamma-glutamate biosynthesis (capsule formation)
MCGRGIDQVLAHPCSPEIYEHYVRSAEGYVLLAEQVNGPIPRRNGSSYVWGAAGPIGAHAAGRADHQSRNRCDPQPRPREQGHQLPREPRECRMSRGCQDQLLRIGQQPCARLGPCWPAGDADDSAETQRESDGRRTQRSRSARTRGAEPCQSAAPDLFVRIDIERHPVRVGCDTRRSRRQLAA